MGNKEILDYVRNTPGNTNPSVLKGMLNSIASTNQPPLVVKPLEQVGTWDFRMDKTFSEIAEYIESGRLDVVIASDANVAGGEVYKLATVNYANNKVANIQFSRVFGNGSSATISTLTANSSSGDVFTGTKVTIAS